MTMASHAGLVRAEAELLLASHLRREHLAEVHCILGRVSGTTVEGCAVVNSAETELLAVSLLHMRLADVRRYSGRLPGMSP